MVTEELPYVMTASGYMDAATKTLVANIPQFKKLDRGSQKINGLKAEWIIYRSRYGEFKVQAKMWALIRGKIAYIITGIASQDKFDQYVDVFDQTASSARIAK